MITIVDYKVGNLGSIQNMLNRIGADSVISSDAEEISKANKLILPGVGAFDSGVTNLKKYGIWEVLDNKVIKEGIPVLGICLGMQLLCNRSEEGKELVLGWIDGEVLRFKPKNAQFKIPHMGWNYLKIVQDSKLFADMYPDPKFYFVHSFYVSTKDDSCIARSIYESPFDAVVEKGNILGTQFHPEKSGEIGQRILKNFLRLKV